MTVRPVVKTVKGMPTSDGAGVRMTRMLGNPEIQMFDPFLMLDHFNTENPGDYIGGFPSHPHRGFETVTYMLDGSLKHADNSGREGTIHSGGIQWMRAGRGIVHSEMPQQEEGRMRGFQLWVNLPAKLKMSEPGYQEFDADMIPVETRGNGVTVKVVAGRTGQGAEGPVGAGAVDAMFYDVVVAEGAKFEEAIPSVRNAMIVVYEGSVRIDGKKIDSLGAGFFGDGDDIVVEGLADSRFLIIAGKPIKEPVAWGGPFVMNTRDEVMQAYKDFQSGRF